MTGKDLLDMAEKQLGHDVLDVAEYDGKWALGLGDRKTGEPWIILYAVYRIDLKTKKIEFSTNYDDGEDFNKCPADLKEYTYGEACKIELDD